MNALILTSCLLVAHQASDAASTGNEHKAPAVIAASVAASPPSGDDGVARRRHAYELRRKTSELLKCEARSTDDNRRAAVLEIIALYCTLQQDPMLTDEQRERLAPRVRSRLVHIARRIQRQQAHRQRETSSNGAGGRLSDAVHGAAVNQATTNAEVVIDADILAQFGGVAGAGAGGGGGQGGFAGAAGGIVGVNDNGEDLVELILTVISPETWNVNGGPGAIYYYRRLRVLVIRAPGEVHDQIGGVLGGLRD